MSKRDSRTWIEISESAARHNVSKIKSIIGPKVKLWAVVKSNAYGHGLFLMPSILETSVYGFCVDSLIEGVKLRDMGIKAPILVLGLTLPNSFSLAKEKDIIITVSNFDVLNALIKSKSIPDFHLKIDTGMHRQGFYADEIERVIKNLQPTTYNLQPNLKGVYTHFASAKDINYPTYTDRQLSEFLSAVQTFQEAGFNNLMLHAAATGGTLINKKYHLDAVRVGIGLYGLWPSKELEVQMSEIGFRPILTWKTVVGEIKKLKKGDYVGYDLVERVLRNSKIAVLPIGYWHGFPRALSGIGEVLIRGRRARVLGRVSMDMIAVDVTDIVCKFGDVATLIGGDGKEFVGATELASKMNASHYEMVTRINPLIERIIV